MKTEYIVTVNETKEVKPLTTIQEVRAWIDQVRNTLAVWGGTPTFTCVERIERMVTL